MLNLLLVLFILSSVLGSVPTIISRDEWDAKDPKSTRNLSINPPTFVVIHHSDTNFCTTLEECKRRVKGIQSYHMDTRRWTDIGYNFLVGGDGNVYEGRGWGIKGAHSPTYNAKSIGICFIGNFTSTNPPDVQIQAAKDLMDYGVNRNLISNGYKVLGHRQAQPTNCPGNNLFKIIKNWPHFLNK